MVTEWGTVSSHWDQCPTSEWNPGGFIQSLESENVNGKRERKYQDVLMPDLLFLVSVWRSLCLGSGS